MRPKTATAVRSSSRAGDEQEEVAIPGDRHSWASGRPTGRSDARAANELRKKGTPPRREGFSEAGVSGGGRPKPAYEREPITSLKSGTSDERIGRASFGRGCLYLRLGTRMPPIEI